MYQSLIINLSQLLVHPYIIPKIISVFNVNLNEIEKKTLILKLYDRGDIEMAVKVSILFNQQNLLPCLDIIELLVQKQKYGIVKRYLGFLYQTVIYILSLFHFFNAFLYSFVNHSKDLQRHLIHKTAINNMKQVYIYIYAYLCLYTLMLIVL